MAQMTGREQLSKVLNRSGTDRVVWTTLVDDRTRAGMPKRLREMSCIEFYRHIGCDILQFGNFALPPDLCVPAPCRLLTPGVTHETHAGADGSVTRRTLTPWGELTSVSKGGHPLKHPVESLADLRVLKNVWSSARYEETSGMEEGFARAEAAIGEDGIYLPTVDPSPVQHLIEYEMGVARFYYLLQDHPEEIEKLLAAMHTCRMQEYEILARRTPAPAVISVENTSTTLISPALYRRYSLPQVRDFVRVMHRHGKKAVLHMCGLLKALLPDIAQTGMDGINGLTPPPIGDVTLEEALDALGEDLVILGGILDATRFATANVSREQIWRALDALYTPRMRSANLALWLQADGISVPLERFLAVRDWVERKSSCLSRDQ